ncbi:MAG TPA: hypothetical protein VGO67_15135 [Verrucomicrobiae bacterium]|jgi:hypothetical protein
MKTKIAISALFLCIGASLAEAQQNTTSPPSNYYGRDSWLNSSSDQLFRANEFSVDIFGAGAGNTEHHDHDFDFNNNRHRDTRGGGGGGMEYFFLRYVGVEAETMALANGHQTESLLGGNLMLRLPIADTGFSPYIFGGGGNEFTYRTEAYEDGGAGLEYRFTHHIGIFGDGRFVTPEHTRDFGLGRFGVRFTF